MTEPEKEREEGKEEEEPKVNVEVSRLLFDVLREQEEIQRMEARERTRKGNPEK